MRRIPLRYVLWTVVLLTLVALGLGTATGLIPFSTLLANFVAFVFWLVLIAVLAVIGGVFLGMLLAHRLISERDFTPFEKEMLKMREDVKAVREEISEIRKKIG